MGVTVTVAETELQLPEETPQVIGAVQLCRKQRAVGAIDVLEKAVGKTEIARICQRITGHVRRAMPIGVDADVDRGERLADIDNDIHTGKTQYHATDN